MTVSTENAYAEFQWSGVETSFNPNFAALDVSYVIVKYEDADGVISTLTRGVHYSVSIGAGNAVTVGPLVLPAAPGTLLISRRTPATVSVQFDDLEDFPASEHQLLVDAAAMRDAEIWSYVGRFVVPFTNIAGVLDFGAYRLRAADPIADDDLATKGYVLQITGVLALQGYVDQAAASAALALTYQTGAQGFQTGAQTAQTLAQLWASAGLHVLVGGIDFSAKSYAQDAAAQAAIATSYANLLNQVIHDFGDFQASTTIVADWGDFH
jgi:hypothetical protein